MAFELRNMFSNIFNKQPQQQNTQQYTVLQMLNDYNTIFTNFSGNAYENELVRTSIHSIATNVAKTKAKHVNHSNSNLEYLLNVRPNQYMSAFDMYYKTITQYYLNNNAYILIQKDKFGSVVGFYPLNYSNVELMQYNDYVYVKFTFKKGQTVTVSYDDVIHLRRHFNESDMYGSSNIIAPSIDLLDTTNKGIANAIKTSAIIKGILQVTGNSLKPEDLKKQKDDFVKDYMNINNTSGLAVTDQKMEYKQLTQDPKIIDDKQMQIIEDKIYAYYNINKKIVMNTFNADEYNAFYESVIEPILIQLSNELTHKLFTPKQRGFGNQIIFTSNRLNYASNDTKVSMCRELVSMGIFSINEARELFNLEPREQDKTIISLNYVDYDKQNAYQLGEETKPKEDEKEDDNE